MIRLLHAYFPSRTLILGISEVVLAILAFVVVTVAIFGASDASLMLGYEEGLPKIALVAGALLLCMYYYDLYESMVLSNRREVVTRLIQVFGTLCVLLSVLYYLYPQARLGSPIFFSGFALLVLVLFGWRRAFLAINSMPRFADRTLLLGDGPLAKPLLAELQARPEVGMRVVGQVGDDEAGDDCSPAQRETNRQKQVENFVESQQIERIVVVMGDRRGKLPVEYLLELKKRGVVIQDGVEVYEMLTGKVTLESLRLSWLLFSPGFCIPSHLLIYKRLLSLVLSLIGMIVSAPLMLLAAIAIKLDSPGPIIYRQQRIGQNGMTFTLYKFRSMIDGADRLKTHKPAEAEDDRFTRVGKWLRRTRIDELPQLYNILRGDMYFVGPRPFVPDQEAALVKVIPFYRHRWSVKPGATGWAQINRGYNATIEDNAEKLAYDLFYIKNISIGLDMLILFQTVKTLLLGRGAR